MAGHGNMFGGSLIFDHRSQEWSIFKSRFMQFCTANDINEVSDKAGTKRRALLLTALVEDTYRVARNLAFPADLDSVEFQKLLEILDKHFVSKRSSFVERYKFYKAEQRVGEDLAEWAARVRCLAQHCGFTTELDTALRDRFILGLEDVKEKEKLFAESVTTLTFARALELAQSVRCARQALQEAAAPAPAPAHPVFAMRSGAPPQGSSDSQCAVCGYKNHSKDQCRFINFTCTKCKVKGHLKRMCKSKIKSNNFMAADDDDIVTGNFDFFPIDCVNGQPMRQMVSIANENILCEIDSGSAVSVLPETIYKKNFATHKLLPCDIILNCYNGSRIIPKGYVRLSVTFEQRTKEMNMFIISTQSTQPALLGRDFISAFNLQLCSLSCNNLGNVDLSEQFKNKYSKLFSDELGEFNKHKITLKIKPGSQLKFFKPRPVPLALKPKVETELQRLVDLGVLEKIDHSDIATPIVPVLRPDGNIRICGDFSVTLNKVLYLDNYPLPRIEDLFSKLHGGVEFSKLDLSRAYSQLVLDESKNLTCINTHKGLFRYNRLVFGLANAPFIFQRTMEQLLSGIEGTCIFLDDILITGSNREIHLQRLEQVLSRLQDAGLRLKQDKCELFKASVEYLGFRIDRDGLHKSVKKIEAILKCACPKNVSELKSFLGMINYYRCFVPNTSSVLSPLHSLLKKGEPWVWGETQQEAFSKIRSELASERVLAHYDPALATLVTADAGPRGLGAVLAQRQPDGSERVVAYASRALTKAERNYAQIQKEAASIVFAIKKFHHYLYGRTVPFILRTDHKPLLSIFGSKKGVPELAANRLQRYALFLSAYNFNIEYVKSEHNVADFLSRSICCAPQEDLECQDDLDKSLYINFVTNTVLTPLTVEDIKRETERDKILLKVKGFIMKGWPNKITCTELQPFFACHSQLSLENGCILRGHKIVIPAMYREQLLNELHTSHFGVVKTKTEARARMWWPHIDRQIEDIIGSCSICNTLRSNPPRAPLAPWPYPARPWERVHLDMFAWQGKQFLMVIDAHSKWIECFLLSITDSTVIVAKLGELFSRYGLVRTLVTDNASNFCSSYFESFCKANGIQHITIAPYHPASNGQAENSVKTVKRAVKIIMQQSTSPQVITEKLNKFLFDYRNSVHCTTGFSPAQLMLGRSLRCRLDLLRARADPTPAAAAAPVSLASAAQHNVCDKQISQSKQYGGVRQLSFNIKDKVLVKHIFSNGNKHSWKQGVIKDKVGTRMYNVFVPELNITLKKHIDHMIAYKGGSIDVPDVGFCGEEQTLAAPEVSTLVQESDERKDDSFCSLPEEDNSLEGEANFHQQSPSPEPNSGLEEEARAYTDERPPGAPQSQDSADGPSDVTEAPVVLEPCKRVMRATRNKNANYKF